MLYQGGPHLKAVHPDNPEIILIVPRHNNISNGVTNEICKKLVELGYDENEVSRRILR